MEEDLALGKSWFGLGRQPTAPPHRDRVNGICALAIAALAACAVTPALARERTSSLTRPATSPHDLPPQDAGLPRPAAEIKAGLQLGYPRLADHPPLPALVPVELPSPGQSRSFYQRARLLRQAQASP